MPNIKIICQDETSIEIDVDLFKKFCKMDVDVDTTAEFRVAANGSQVEFIKEYCEHHQKSEAPPSPETVSQDMTIKTAFSPDKKDKKDTRDAWDSDFLTRVIESESDSFLIDFSRVVLLFGMETLRQKVTKAIAIAVVAKAGTTKADKLAEEFRKFALKAKA